MIHDTRVCNFMYVHVSYIILDISFIFYSSNFFFNEQEMIDDLNILLFAWIIKGSFKFFLFFVMILIQYFNITSFKFLWYFLELKGRMKNILLVLEFLRKCLDLESLKIDMKSLVNCREMNEHARSLSNF